MFRVVSKYCVLLFAFIVSLVCCTSPIDTIEIPINIGLSQEEISELISSRKQVLDVIYNNNKLSLFTKDSIVIIDTRGIPFLQPGMKGREWLINGVSTSIPVNNNTSGSLSFPNLSLSSGGNLLVDGSPTVFYLSPQSLETLATHNEEIWAIVQVKDYLCFYRHSGDKIIIPVIDSPAYIVPDYFMECVVEKELLAEKKINSLLDKDCLSFVFFTDAHWGANQHHSPAIIKHIVDYTPLDQVLFGGDVNTNYTRTVEETMKIGFDFQRSFSFLGSNLICLFGNHDDNTSGQVQKIERHLSERQVYAYLQSQMINAHYWDYYNFYFDDLTTNTRFMCLDTGRWYESALRGSTFKTAKFVVECLSSVPDNWHIVAASHIWTNLKDFKTAESHESVYVRPIIEILENYNNRIATSFTYGEETLHYDFSNAGALVEYCIGGHTHADAVVYSKGGLPIITVTCDGQQEVAGGAPYQTGTINEQCVTMVVNDYKNRIVNIFHIGRGEDTTVIMWGN